MKTQLFALIAFAILLAGCTANRQDSAFNPPAQPSLRQQGAAQQGAAGQSPQNATAQPGAQNASQPQNASARQLTLTAVEVAKHNTANDCWAIISGKVLDLSSFTSHPGGSAYVPYCGTDATDAYNTKGGAGSQHSSYAVSMMSSFELGTLGQQVAAPPANQANVSRLQYNGSGDDGWDENGGLEQYFRK